MDKPSHMKPQIEHIPFEKSRFLGASFERFQGIGESNQSEAEKPFPPDPMV